MPPVATDPTAPAAAGTVLRSEHGFTLIELLVAMVTAVVVLGGLLTFIIDELNQGNTIESRSYSASQAQIGLNQLTRDLSEAIGSPDAVTLSQVSRGTGNCTTTTCMSITFEIPNTSSSDTAEQVVWTCPYNATPTSASVGFCTRELVGTSTTMVNELNGVESLAFYNASSPSTPLTSASDPAYLGLTLDVADISQRNTTQTVAVTGMTNPIVIQTGVDLRNFL